MASHQRKFYQTDTGQSWWLCQHERTRTFILFEDAASQSQTEIQVTNFFGAEYPQAAQIALVELMKANRVTPWQTNPSIKKVTSRRR